MDQKEFIKLYDENVAAIFRYIFLRVNSKEVAQDLTSDVFLRGWQYMTAGNSEVRNHKSFFYKIAKNLITDFYRRKSRTEVSLEEITIQIPNLKDDPAQETNLGLELEPIKKALAEIKDDYAEIIIWHYLDELTIMEIAEILGKSEGAVRVILSRALKQIKEIVDI